MYFLIALLIGSAHAEFKSGFGDVSVNRLDWTGGTERKSTKEDFTFLEIEGGGDFSWGDLYGFFDYENPGFTGQDTRSASKGVINYYLFGTKLSLYGHIYDFNAHGFAEQNRVYGLGYSLSGKGWWFKPFLGVNDVQQTYFSGMNGYMGGWVVGYMLDIAGQKFMLSDWHEIEFARRRSYAAGQGGNTSSHNGALSLWWFAPHNLSPGLQYRYAHSKLGTPGSLGAVIYSLKYLF